MQPSILLAGFRLARHRFTTRKRVPDPQAGLAHSFRGPQGEPDTMGPLAQLFFLFVMIIKNKIEINK